MYSANAPPPMPTPMTWAPGSTPVTPSSTAMISPAPSMPARYGGCGPPANAPCACEMSTKLTPAAVIRIRTSSGPGSGTGASVIRRRSSGPFRDVCCSARMVSGMLIRVRDPSLLGARGRPASIKGDSTSPGKESLRTDRSSARWHGRHARTALACHVRPEPEQGDQLWVAERADPADACGGDSEHADPVRPVAPPVVAYVGGCRGLSVGAVGQHAPVARRSQEVVAQEWHARRAACEPGAQRRRL